MKKVFKVTFVLLFLLSLCACTNSSEGKDDAVIKTDDLTVVDREDDVIEYIPIEIDEYYRNINDYIDIPVKLKGYWSRSDIDGTINDFNFTKSIELNLYEEVLEELNQRLMFGQRIYAYGKIINENDNLVFKTDKIEDFTKVQNDNFWNGSEVITNMNLSNVIYDSNEYTEYEFTGIILTGGYAERKVVMDGLGLVLELVTENEAVISNGTAVRFLVSNLHYDEFNDYYTAKVIDYKVLE